jgi:LEA14-like dessication related protein
MDISIFGSRIASLAAIAVISGCAGMETMISSPSVELTSIELTRADFDRQTFLLGFDVSNPNAFPLPVRSVHYRLRLGEQQFASGETQGNFTVPSNGNGNFTISVDLDMLRMTSYVSTMIQTGMRRNIDYELSGSLTVDIPLAPPLQFSNDGNIELRAAGL